MVPAGGPPPQTGLRQAHWRVAFTAAQRRETRSRERAGSAIGRRLFDAAEIGPAEPGDAKLSVDAWIVPHVFNVAGDIELQRLAVDDLGADLRHVDPRTEGVVQIVNAVSCDA